MISIPTIVGVMSCGFVLCLGLSNGAQAGNAASVEEEMKTEQSGSDQSDLRQGGQAGDKRTGAHIDGVLPKAGNTIEGEVLRVEGDNYFVKGQDGKEVRLHTDETTQKTGSINQGDRIEAKMDEQNHALSIRSAQGTDAAHGNAAGRPNDSTLETGQTGSMGQ
ncbi:MAG: hypothetical protein HXY51_09855 [Nitrospirae bacterium]|nr:hypothetical protein [Nitrospirota bacterium]